MTVEQLCERAGITVDQLIAYIQQLAILGAVAGKQAEMVKAAQARQVAIQEAEAASHKLAEELAVLEAQRDSLLGGG